MDTRPLVSTPFTASSTADEVLEDVDLTGVRAIVTGASSGLGIETARALTAAGAEVTLAVRNTAAGASATETIARSTGGAPPRVVRLDLADRAGVTRFVDAWDGPLHLLVNNAGVVTGGLERTPEGWELHFATNHLGHFALATGLHQALARGAAERGGARIVSVSSTAHMRSGIDFDDLHFERRSHDPQTAYAQSKTANSLFAVEATRRWGSAGIVANAVNPGGVATGLQRNFTPEQKASLDAAEAAGVFTYKTVEREPPPVSSRPSPPSSPTPAVTTSTTGRRPTRCRTMPTSRSTRTVSRSGRLIPPPPSACGPSQPICCAPDLSARKCRS